ncbi:MAG: ATP-binding protein, partial [bacterium]
VLPRATSDLEADELRHLYDVLAALYRITGLVSHPTTLDELLAGVLEVIFELLPADHASILFADGPEGGLVPRAARCADAADHTVAVSETICREVMSEGRGVLTGNASEDARFRGGDSIQLFGIRSAMCVPIHTSRQLLGVLYLDRRSAHHPFTERDLDLLNAVGSEVGLAVENLRLVEQNLEAERLAATGRAVAGLSHYIKNILQSIEAARVLLDAAIADDNKDDLAFAWGALDQNIGLISELVLNMLSFSRRPEPRYQPCDPNALARQLADLVAGRAEKSGCTLDLDLDPHVPAATVDPAAVHRALLNLLHNAIDVTDQGTVRLATRFDPAERRVRWAVSDQGPGVPSDQRDAIFEAFYTTKGARGTGLGLAVTRKLVEQLGGRVTVDSEAGRGATFTIDLPVGPTEEALP